MTALQRGQGAPRVVASLSGLADVRCACQGVQAAMGERGIGVLRIQESGEAGAQFRFTHVTSSHAVGCITVASDFTFGEQDRHGAEFKLQPDEDVAGVAIHGRPPPRPRRPRRLPEPRLSCSLRLPARVVHG